MGEGHFETAQWHYEQAVALAPEMGDAHFNLGASYQARSLHHLALPHYERGVALMADPSLHIGNLLNTKMRLCDWHGLDALIAQVEAHVLAGQPSCPPFQVTSFSGDPFVQRKAAELWLAKDAPQNVVESYVPLPKPAGERIRIAYFSADFHSHPVSYLMAELFERHDKSQFELIAFSNGRAPKDDPYRARVQAAFETWVDTAGVDDAQVLAAARDMRIDIAIELTGLTQGGRIGTLMQRVAPVQMHYLGYPATTAAANIDYMIADEVLVPRDLQRNYSERMLYLPYCFQVSDRQRPRANEPRGRTALDLPEHGFVFCSFCNGYKITPIVFDSWMRILQAVPQSVLMLYADSEFAANNLRREADVRGVSPKRLVFGRRVGLPEYLARYQACDLFLDTLPYNAGTTANDVLWMGLPMLTVLGETMTGRMATSLLHTLGLDELIASDWADYESKAIELATQPQRYAAMKDKLTQQRSASPLFDTAKTTRAVESGYRMALERYWQGLAPDHLYVPADI